VSGQVVEADLTWTGAAFTPGVQVAVDDTGRIEAVGALGRAATHPLAGSALLPGFAFQRGLRGRGERFPEGSGSFWTWRDAMYGLVDALDPRGFRSLCRQTFEEMRDAGITSVGEFHYLHHVDDHDFALDEVVLDAAAEAGIRVVLLETFYRTGGIGQPLDPRQRRFDTPSLDRFWRQVDALARSAAPAQSIGVAAHSVRAVSLHDLEMLHVEAKRRGLPFHMHVEEQRREIDECLAAYGRPPMAVLADRLDLDRRFTAVHCTHTAVDDMTTFLFAGGSVCVCPLTEANLGDGLPHLAPVHETGGRLSLGTDANARIAFTEEMRWLEYGQRLRAESRGAGDDGRVAPVLLEAATAGGARALGLETGAIEPGRWADFAVVNIAHPSLVACDVDGLLEAVVFGGADGAITATCVAGDWRETR
jgi:formimidoylglutamate deiminase